MYQLGTLEHIQKLDVEPSNSLTASKLNINLTISFKLDFFQLQWHCKSVSQSVRSESKVDQLKEVFVIIKD